jgi:hypothetical protein
MFVLFGKITDCLPKHGFFRRCVFDFPGTCKKILLYALGNSGIFI